MSPSSCAVCQSSVPRLRQVRLQGRTFCGHRCATVGREAANKARLDGRDKSPTICRCDGAPRPLEAVGPHCARCRRMFSAGVRLWLVRRERRQRLIGFASAMHWLEEAAAQLPLHRLRQ